MIKEYLTQAGLQGPALIILVLFTVFFAGLLFVVAGRKRKILYDTMAFFPLDDEISRPAMEINQESSPSKVACYFKRSCGAKIH